jgi:hypothetical protein
MVIVSIIGYATAAQFISLEGLEVPYYVTLIGAGVLKLSSQPQQNPVAGAVPLPLLDIPPAAVQTDAGQTE